MSSSTFFPWLPTALERLDDDGLLRRRRCVVPLPDGWCEIDGRRLRNFASNDYLNLAHDPRLISAARDALDRRVLGSAASALVTGRTDWHVRLEQQLAAFEQQPSAVLFPTGYAANLGTVGALVETGDVVFCDRLNHASLVDACKLSGAKLRVYRHDRLDILERELQKTHSFRRRLIVTDGVFSMDGDFAPLPELCRLATQYDAPVVVDEAHGTGVFGTHGRGICEELGVEHQIAVRIGTLSKAVGCLGGFVAASSELTTWIWNRARTQIFSTSLPPAVCAAACAAVEIIQAEPHRRAALHALCTALREKLTQAGVPFVPESHGPIVPVLLGDPEAAVDAAAALEQRGLLVAAIRPPTVPAGTSRLRISLTTAHTHEDLDRLVAALTECLSRQYGTA